MDQYDVTGMTCAACSARVEKAVGKVPGVTECSVNLLTNSMGVEGTASSQEIIAAVQEAGYGASLKGSAANGDTKDKTLNDSQSPMLLKRLIASLCILLPLMYVSMGHGMWGWPLPSFFAQNPVILGLTQLLLTSAVMVINQRFFISGFKSLIHRAPNMDTLVSLGATAAFGYSTVILFLMADALFAGDVQTAHHYIHEFYFESAAMILTLITLGKLLEARSKGKTTNALKSLMKLAPKTATVLRNGTQQTIPVEQVVIGDVFVVRPGENIPVDGTVIDGESAVNESSLTGESIPVDKSAGDAVRAGTINQSGYIRCRAERVGEDTTLNQIIKMMSDATATKAPIAKIADKVSGVFVPAVMIIAAITTIVWLIAGQSIGFALARGISVLVISCPCALGLATPVAIMVGNGVGAKNGILFKTATALEHAGRADIVVLDKTGTVTCGAPEVTDIIPAEGETEESLLRLAYSLESKSEHPLSHAVTVFAAAKNIHKDEIENFTVLPGNGLQGTLGEDAAYGGNIAFLRDKCDLLPDTVSSIESLASQGKTPLLFAKGNKFIGIIAVADVIKSDAPEAVKQLKNMGIKVIMLSGDNKHTAKFIADKSGIDEVIAEVLPAEKESHVRSLKSQGKVIMVGDGINDAPALTSADTGIAIGAGTDVAIDAADVVLMNSNLSDVPAAVRLSRRTLQIIKENLFWAFIYNIIGIPLAAGVFISLTGWQMNPMFGAAAMSLSSFCVVTNALRINLFNPKSARHDKPNRKKYKKIKENKKMQKTLIIEGMMCGHCEARVKKTLEGLDGVTSATVSHTEGTAVINLSKDVPDSVLKSAVEAQDYTVTEIK